MFGTMRGRFAHKAAAVLASAVMVSSMNGVLPVHAEEIGEAAKASSKSNVVNVDNEIGEVKIAGKGSAMIYAVYNGNSVKDKFGSKRKYKIKVRVV